MITQQLLGLLNDAEAVSRQENSSELNAALQKLEAERSANIKALQQAYNDQLQVGQQTFESVKAAMTPVHHTAQAMGLATTAVSGSVTDTGLAPLDGLSAERLRITALKASFESAKSEYDAAQQAGFQAARRRKSRVTAAGIAIVLLVAGGLALLIPNLDKLTSQASIINRFKLDIVGSPHQLEFSPDGQSLLITEFGGLALVDVQTGQITQRYGFFRQGQFSPDGRSVLLRGHGGDFALRDVVSGEDRQKFTGFESTFDTDFSPDGKTLVAVGCDRSPCDDPSRSMIHLWNVEDGELINSFEMVSPDSRIVMFAPDGRTILTHGCVSGETNCDRSQPVLVDSSTGKEIRRFIGHKGRTLASLMLSSDGTRIVSSVFRVREIVLWDTATGQELQRFQPDNDGSQAVLSPDGQTLLTFSGSADAENPVDDPSITLWNANTGALIRKFIAHHFGATAVAFSPDGQTFVSAGCFYAGRECDNAEIIHWRVR